MRASCTISRFQFVSTLALVLMLGVIPALAQTRPSSAAPLTPDDNVFPIGCFPGPPAEANTLSNWRSIQAANFTVACPIYRYDQPANLTMLDHCRELGLKAVVNVKVIPPTTDRPLPADWRQQVAQTVATYADHKALFGYMLKDEPCADQFGQIRDVVAEFATRDPSHCTCVNLFPIYATNAQLGTSTYREHIDRFMHTVNPDFLCYDHYTFLKDGTDRPDFFENLEQSREVCKRYDKPGWIVILSGWHEHLREPTEAELRWQVYGALAYGIKGIFYFTYWPVNDSYTAIVDYAGKPQRLYEPVRRLNREILQLGRTLLQLESTDVFHTGRTIPQGCRRLPAGMPLTVPRDLPLVIGFFRGPGDSRYAMVVNRDCQESVSAELRVSADFESVSRISEQNGLASKVVLDNSRTAIDLAPGSGVLLRLNRKEHDGRFHGRIAYSCDGNHNDRDDWAASPMTLAILAEAGLRERLVHFDYNCILPLTDPSWEKTHAESVLGTAQRYGFDMATFFDCRKDRDGAVASIAQAINDSSADNPLYFIIAGPMEVPFLGIQKSDAAKRQFVYCISHSRWNDGFASKYAFAFTKRSVIEQNVHWVQIRDQNRRLSFGRYGRPSMPKEFAPYFWMRDSGDAKVRWLWERMLVSTRPDPSDAGMTYFLATGDEECDPAKLKRLIENHRVPVRQATRTTIRIEAENFRHLVGCSLEDRNDKKASHRLNTRLSGGMVGRIHTRFDEPFTSDSARYDVEVRYFDVPGPRCRFTLFVGGVAQGSAWVSPGTGRGWTSQTVRAVRVGRGDEIRVELEADGKDAGKLDYVQLDRLN